MKIGILATHPIQYQSPLFRELAKESCIELKVYYCHKPSAKEQGAGFCVDFQWDVDLTSGFDFQFLKNMSKTPAQGFNGYNCPELKTIIQTEQFDYFIVHGWFYKAAWQAYQACWKTETKLVVRSDSQLPQENLNLKRRIKETIKNFLYPKFIKKIDLCLPYGTRSAEYFTKYGGENIQISPHFIDNDFFEKQIKKLESENANLKNQWGIAQGAIVFLFCGKFQYKKCPLDIIKAFHQVSKTIKHQASTSIPHLVMVGDGELKKECETYVKKHQLPVKFTGFLNQSEISCAYSLSDCLVLASDSTETWGLVTNEAMASGMTAIVSDACGCVPELIKENKTGLTFRKGNTQELSKKMLDIIINPNKLSNMKENAKKHIQNYSVNIAAEQLLDAIKNK